MRPAFCYVVLALAISGCSAATNAAAVPSPNGSVVDSSGKRFAIDGKLYIAGMVFGSGPTGELQAFTGAKPRLLGSIAGSASQLTYVAGVATDAHGNMFVSQNSGSGRSCDGCGILEFAADRYGNVGPIATIPTIGAMSSMAFDQHGNLYGAGCVTGSGKGAGAVYRFDRGSYEQSRRLDPAHYGFGIALGADGTIYMSSRNYYKRGGSVEVFAPGVTGSSRPIGVISGARSQMSGPKGIAIDGEGNIFVGQAFSNSITVYPAATSNGDVAPMRTIGGPDTQLSYVSNLAFDQNGNLFVESSSRVLFFAPNAEGDAKPIASFAVPKQFSSWEMTLYPELGPG